MAIYMRFGDAKGDVTSAGHVGWIEILSVSWDMKRWIRSAVGVGYGRESTSANVSELAVSKLIDSSSQTLVQGAFVGEAQDCQIDFTRVAQGEESVYRSIKLSGAIIAGYWNQGTSTERPTEQLRLNFIKIAITDTNEAFDGSTGSNSIVTYDLTKAKTV